MWSLFGAWTPTPLHIWRIFLARLFGARIAKSAHLYPGVRIWNPANLEMGEFACLGRRVDCYCMGKITLEPFAVISQGAHLCSGTHDIDDEYLQLKTAPITVGRNAWVAAEAFVGPGVFLHEGAVLGARAVLFRDLDAWSVAVGNPAQVVRMRKQRASQITPEQERNS